MIRDPFRNFGGAPGMPARQAFPIEPGAELRFVPSAIFVGTGGDIALRAVDSDEDVVYRNVSSGTYLTVRAAFVRAEGTSAADLVGEL